jgi:hypothetical protein
VSIRVAVEPTRVPDRGQSLPPDAARWVISRMEPLVAIGAVLMLVAASSPSALAGSSTASARGRRVSHVDRHAVTLRTRNDSGTSCADRRDQRCWTRLRGFWR